MFASVFTLYSFKLFYVSFVKFQNMICNLYNMMQVTNIKLLYLDRNVIPEYVCCIRQDLIRLNAQVNNQKIIFGKIKYGYVVTRNLSCDNNNYV